MKPWMKYVAAALVGLVIGVSANSSSETADPETTTITETAVKTVDPSAAELAQTRQDLRQVRGDVRSRRADLREVEKKLSGAKAAVKRGTIPGTGTFIVGTDIDPGTYRASASPGCYWARLSSLDTSDINDNSNADGPVVVEILSSDKAFETSDCADFRKIG